MKNTVILTLIAIAGICLSSCKDGSGLDSALKYAGDNRQELEKALEHYRNDPLKYKAAVFLIENMPGHYSHSDTAYMNAYYAAIDSVMLLCKNEEDNIRDSLFLQTVTRFTSLKRAWVEDVRIIKSGYLIDHIDRAFHAWQAGEWAQHIDFDDFCEYLLPYKICETQDLDNWRDYMSRYGDTLTLSRLKYCRPYVNSAYMACLTMNGSLRDSIRIRINNDVGYIPVRRISSLLKATCGVCDDYNLMALALMRAHGIPTVMDFTPQWPFRSLGHSWLTLIESSGKKVVFEGSGLDPANPHKEDHPMAKAFRKTYARNREMIDIYRSEKFIPPKFATPFIKDVTEEYQATVDLEIPVKDSRNHTYAYLSVFDNASWTPIHWGKLKNKKVRFNKMGKRAAYLPVFYESNGICAFSDPVIVHSSGAVETLTADTCVRRHLTLLRKYPPFEVMYSVAYRSIGAKIQAASDSLFTNPVTLHTVEDFGVLAGEVNLGGRADSARYWRYLSPDSAYCNVAELFFYEKNSDIPATGKIIGTPGSWIPDGRHNREAAFDRDLLTYFDAPLWNDCWVGMDFGKPVCIDKIIYYPRNDGNCIEVGDDYELFYWGDNQWKSLGRKKAIFGRLEFDDCPGNALFLLHDYTKGKEERIFTYENGEQVWW
ncbi:MAG: transglutaminase-like domain-containing protein [Tannerella sp.]|jgi:hypothetical protein|nr:transglutaminase-like domain-containing protein [Tannerella sp.]